MRHPAGRRGVTLIEMLVVLVIIGLVATLTTLAVGHVLVKSKRDTARAQLSMFASAVLQFKMEQNRFPASLNDLETAPSGLRSAFPPGGYLQTKGVPLDPWDHPYAFVLGSEEGFTVTCLGEDGIEGGNGAGADLSTSDPVGEK